GLVLTRGRRRGARHLRAVDVLAAHLVDRPLEGVVGGLTGAVSPQEPRLPAAELVLVQQLEVEEPRHGRLAVREEDRIPELRRLVDRGLPVLLLWRDCREDSRVVLPAAVEASLVGRRCGVVPGLEVPDRDDLDAGVRLS